MIIATSDQKILNLDIHVSNCCQGDATKMYFNKSTDNDTEIGKDGDNKLRLDK